MATTPVVWLASRSPRRRELLNEHGVQHAFDTPGFDDADLAPGRVTPAQWVAALAYLKAAAGVARGASIPGVRVVLGADTACVKDGRLIGTPRDAGEAGAMIRSLSGGTHAVVTGVSMIDVRTGRRTLFAETATVRVGALPDTEIDAYVASGGWEGKAGGYNLRERLDAGWPIEYEGDPTTIMGLPMSAVMRRLERMGLVEGRRGPVGVEDGGER
ncbi:MAG: Maf family protein [Phycisphaeraceae bacterium]|nr:MAG: Maf family protein [Phycisphaeraceae bacterium]